MEKEGTEEKLLESRWKADKNVARIKTDLEKLPALISESKAINVTQLAQLVAELNQQSKNKQRTDLDAYYATLHNTGQEPEAKGVTIDLPDDDTSDASGLSQAESDRLDQLQAQLKANRDEWFNNSDKKTATEKTTIRDFLTEFLRLKRRDSPEWHVGGYQGLFQLYGVQY